MTTLHQQDLFGEEVLAKPVSKFRVNPVHIKYRLSQYVDELRELETWPWSKELVDLLRERTWPCLFSKLEDDAEAEKWKALLDAEWNRLTAATQRAA